MEGTSVEGLGSTIPANDAINIIEQLEKERKEWRVQLWASKWSISNINTSDIRDLIFQAV